MPALFRRQSNVECFFCQTVITPIPPNPHSFRCPQCSCWNRYDANGEIMSDEPAMHDESLNRKSFAKRASPRKDQLPTSFSKGQFCHTCQTNQMLLVNLLSSYLPSPEHPDYASRLELLPEYRDSLHVRYPPVCALCLPSVHEEIKRKDHMARTKALGGWLNETQGKEKKRQVPSLAKEREKFEKQLIVWRIRGCLWVCTMILSWAGYWTASLEVEIPSSIKPVQPILPVLVLFSIFWTGWNPTYQSVRKARLQGRDLRVRGHRQYITCQMIVWFLRSLTAIVIALPCYYPAREDLDFLHRFPSLMRNYFLVAFLLDVSAFVISCTALRLQYPPPIRLIATSTHLQAPSARSTPALSREPSLHPSLPPPATASEPDLFASLSLSSKPVVSPTNPIFGMPSLLSSTAAQNPTPSQSNMEDDEDETDADAMDWTPTHPSSLPPAKPKKSKLVVTDDDNVSWLRPQRFFPPEHPTGLETLLASTKLVDDTESSTKSSGAAQTVQQASMVLGQWLVGALRTWWWVGAISLLLVPGGAIAVRAWRNRDMVEAYFKQNNSESTS